MGGGSRRKRKSYEMVGSGPSRRKKNKTAKAKVVAATVPTLEPVEPVDANDWKSDWAAADSIDAVRQLMVEALQGERKETPGCGSCAGEVLCESSRGMRDALMSLNRDPRCLTIESGAGRERADEKNEYTTVRNWCRCGHECWKNLKNRKKRVHVVQQWKEYLVAFIDKATWDKHLRAAYTAKNAEVLVWSMKSVADEDDDNKEKVVLKLQNEYRLGVVTTATADVGDSGAAAPGAAPAAGNDDDAPAAKPKECASLRYHQLVLPGHAIKGNQFCECVGQKLAQSYVDVLAPDVGRAIVDSMYVVLIVDGQFARSGLVAELADIPMDPSSSLKPQPLSSGAATASTSALVATVPSDETSPSGTPVVEVVDVSSP